MINYRLILVVCLLLTAATRMVAQLGNPREKFSIAGSVSYAFDNEFTWSSDAGENLGDGQLKEGLVARITANVRLLRVRNLTFSLSPFYDYTSLSKAESWGPGSFYLPSAYHHLGSSFSTHYQTKISGRPLTLFGVGTGHFSQHGFENASGILGGLVTLKQSRTNYLSLGAICLLGTAVSWPLFPLVMYRQQFDDRWSISVMMLNNYLYYHISPKLKCAVGMELETSRLYFRPDAISLPEASVISILSERFGMFADWQAADNLNVKAGVGLNVPFYATIRDADLRVTFMEMNTGVKPFVNVGARWGF